MFLNIFDIINKEIRMVIWLKNLLKLEITKIKKWLIFIFDLYYKIHNKTNKSKISCNVVHLTLAFCRNSSWFSHSFKSIFFVLL